MPYDPPPVEFSSDREDNGDLMLGTVLLGLFAIAVGALLGVVLFA